MKEPLTGPGEIGLIVLRTVVVCAIVLSGFRPSGKREGGQLAPFDFAFVLLTANALLRRLAADHESIEKPLRRKTRMLVYRGDDRAPARG